MKLKKSSVPSAAPGGAAIAERFRIDGDPREAAAPSGPSKAAATTVFVFGLIATGIMVAITVMMYVNWELVKLQ